MLALLLSALVIGAPPTEDEAKILGGYLAAALAKDPRVEVTSAEDVRRALEFEAEKQTLGCAESTCLNEIAGALGADAVVFGHVGKLDDRLVINASLFDAMKGTTPGRIVVEAKSLGEVTGPLAASAPQLLEAYLSTPRPDGAKVKIVVLDLRVQGIEARSEPMPLSTVALVSGAAASLVGVALLGSSFLVHQSAGAATTPQVDIDGLRGARDAMGVIGIGSVVVGVGAAALGAWPLVSGEP